ncbi:restriction endonuclease [Pseudoxanthomonas sacheonensis]|uniref:restriction endonuclease n=1 Tax=Pseudoxanthomonas sacheonensis TaxID=443615 RepID=UPI0013D2AC2D|nr:restriction endonuclease [Pseudoxanthomonas sacheonensis]
MTGLKNVRNRRDDALARVGWDQLETMLADYYRGQGWSVDHVGTGGGRTRFDGGIDLKLRKDNEYVLVQCKHWNAKQVPHNAVNELLGLKTNENATGAIVITSGEFTQAAHEAATRQGHVQLVDGDSLRAMLGPQLDALTSLVPPLPIAASSYRRKRRERSVGERSALLFGALVFAVVVCYGLFRLATWPMHHTFQVQLPQGGSVRVQRTPVPYTRPQAPAPEAKVEIPPRVEPGMTGAEKEEWERKNAESMRILEENEKQETEAGAVEPG